MSKLYLLYKCVEFISICLGAFFSIYKISLYIPIGKLEAILGIKNQCVKMGSSSHWEKIDSNR